MDDTDDNQSGDDEESRNKMDFVRNPAEIRDEAERRRQSKQVIFFFNFLKLIF